MKNKFWFVLIGLYLSIQGCLRPVDGCINPRAKDFNPEADRNTTCDFYDIYYDLDHRLRDSIPMTDTTLIWDIDNSGFYVNQLYLFLYQSHLIQKNNLTTFTSISDITYQEGGSSKYLEDNVAIFSLRESSVQACDWTHLGSFDTLTVHLGLPSTIQTYSFLNLDPSHEFHPNSSLYSQGKLISASIQLIHVTTNDTINFQVDTVLPITATINRQVVDGADLRLSCRLDYDSILYNISIQNDAAELVGQQILQNIHAHLSIE